MSYSVRLMRREDVDQVTEIDREAFPAPWPPTNYQQELQNRLAHYLVAYDEEKAINEAGVKPFPEMGVSGLVSRVWRLFRQERSFDSELNPSGGQYILGYAGFWIMADEAHIISIAVRESCRRLGIGELLLISAIDLATELKARIITLEVRVSNTAAQSLYQKYGFIRVGLRRGYYTDNNEDAILMSVEDITSALFQAHLNQLKQARSQSRVK